MTDANTEERDLWLALLNASAEAEVEAEPIQVVSAELVRAGIDVESLQRRIQARCDAALDASPHDWRQRAKGERERELARRARLSVFEGLDAATLRGRIAARLASAAGPAQVHHRNLDEASVSDLADLLADLEFLADED